MTTPKSPTLSPSVSALVSAARKVLRDYDPYDAGSLAISMEEGLKDELAAAVEALESEIAAHPVSLEDAYKNLAKVVSLTSTLPPAIITVEDETRQRQSAHMSQTREDMGGE